MKMRGCIVVLLLLSTSGCIGLFGQESSSSAVFVGTNQGNDTVTFEVFVVNSSAEYRVVISDGRTYVDQLYGRVRTSNPGDGRHFTSVDPVESYHSENLSVTPGNSTEISVPITAEGSALLVAVHNESGEIVTIVSLNCSRGTPELEATYYGHSAAGTSYCL
ncbi:hypothetical protein [Halogeometricum limi]|uniref:Uncharacterized protein n=1 Tax=Halogeometricum limi TaxID=555875 RepID=A0A1I6HEW4_9EURY|nr:hypothetical protein [Halogeometricum limi]SFR53026.1 hypothetical protein SAMN04488124_2160 [Halogeometricum limi]